MQNSLKLWKNTENTMILIQLQIQRNIIESDEDGVGQFVRVL